MRSAHQPEYLEFVSQLRRVRKAAGVTQAELARRLHKPQSFVSKAETCERRLDVVEAARWCAALKVSLSRVLPAELRAVLKDD
jgi:transcriptional regulator with XRE-family HTH domain